ncbi:MAG: rhomboid family intramembrane serine protease, partial [Paracoccaceae bacterium]
PSRRTPIITYVLIALNVLVFFYTLAQSETEVMLRAFYDDWAMIPAEVTQGQDLHSVLSSMFLHGGWAHLGGNMLFLWIFGDNMEDEMGHVGFLLFYLLGGLAAAATHVLADPASPIPTVGASGAIAAVMGGYLLLFPKARVDVLFIFIVIFRIIPVPAWIMLALWFGLQIFSGVGMDASTGGVAYWAHAGGFVAGLLMTVPIWMRRGATAFWQRNEGHPPHEETHYRRTSIPVVPRGR